MIESMEKKLKKLWCEKNPFHAPHKMTRNELWKYFFSTDEDCTKLIQQNVEKSLGKKITTEEMALMITESYKILSTRIHMKISELQSENYTVSIPRSNEHSMLHCTLLNELGSVFNINTKIVNISHLRLDEDGHVELNI